MKRVILVSLLAALAFVSCQKLTTLELAGDEMPIVVTTTIDGEPQAQNVAAARSASNGAASRAVSSSATKQAWVDGDQFSFYLNLNSEPLVFAGNTHGSFNYDNLRFDYSAALSKFTTTAGSPAGTIYFPYRKSNVDMWGVYPFDNTITTLDATRYSRKVSANQSVAGNVTASDFLVAHSANIAPNNTLTPVDLLFKHKMSLLRIEITIPTEVDGKSFDATNPIDKIEIHNTKTECTYDFNQDKVTPTGTVQVVTPLALGHETNTSSQEVYTYEAVVVPQTVASDQMMIYVVANYGGAFAGTQGLFMLTLAADYELEMEKQCKMSVSFENEMRLRLNGSEVVKWSTGTDKEEIIDQEPVTIAVGNIDWAGGNLVWDGKNGCTIGARGDAGLYFQFGSLVGWAGGASGDGRGKGSPALAAKVWPAGLSATPTWSQYYFNETTPATGVIGTDALTSDNASNNAQGDPCRFYLGNPWRMATSVEWNTMLGVSGAALINWGGANLKGHYDALATGAWLGTAHATNNPSTSLFMLQSGSRAAADGAMSGSVTTYYYSSNFVSTGLASPSPSFDATGITPAGNVDRKIGAPVRCVKAPWIMAFDPRPMASTINSTTKLMVDFTFDAAWSITGVPAWASVTPSTLSGNKIKSAAALNFSFKALSANTANTARSAQITITATNASRGISVTKKITITQNGI